MGIRQATPFHKNLIVTEIVEATLTVVCLWPYTLQRTLMDQWTDGWLETGMVQESCPHHRIYDTGPYYISIFIM